MYLKIVQNTNAEDSIDCKNRRVWFLGSKTNAFFCDELCSSERKKNMLNEEVRAYVPEG